HDRYFLDNVVTRVVEIADGKAKSFPGNYSDYLRMRELGDAAAAKAAARAPAKSSHADTGNGKESGGDRRDRLEREKRAKNRLRKAERELEEGEEKLFEFEEAIRLLENELAKPEVAADYHRVEKLTEKLESVRANKEAAENDWMSL